LNCLYRTISYQNKKDFTVQISKYFQVTEILTELLNPTLLYRCKSWTIREEDKSKITSVEMNFIRRMAKYTWQDYGTIEDILSEIKINPVVKEIQNYINKLLRHIQ
jgi:uncharacterized protein YaaW (UPF0174 family)